MLGNGCRRICLWSPGWKLQPGSRYRFYKWPWSLIVLQLTPLFYLSILKFSCVMTEGNLCLIPLVNFCPIIIFHTLETSLSNLSCVMFYGESLQSLHSCHPAKMLYTFKLINLVEKLMNWVILLEHSLFLQVSSYLQIFKLPWLWGYPVFLPVFNAQLWLVGEIKISRLEKQIPQLRGICTAELHGSIMLSTWLSCLVSLAVCLLILQY